MMFITADMQSAVAVRLELILSLVQSLNKIVIKYNQYLNLFLDSIGFDYTKTLVVCYNIISYMDNFI